MKLTEEQLQKIIKGNTRYNYTIPEAIDPEKMTLIMHIRHMESQLDKLQNTLEWYADIDKYSTQGPLLAGSIAFTVEGDRGERARQTLQSLKEVQA